MKIPKILITKKFYLAISKTEAYSSWNTLSEALDCFTRISLFNPENIHNVIGIIKVDNLGSQIVFKPRIKL